MPPPPKQPTPTPSKQVPADELETIPFVTLKELGRDKFAVVKIHTRGRIIVDEEMASEVLPRVHAEDQLRVVISQMFLDPRTRVI
jgi:hypothetical protein